MRLFLLVASAVAVTLGTSGCGLFAGGDDNVVAPPMPQSAAAQPFSQPIVKPKFKSRRVAALIQPTNPDERLKAIRSGRSDPFAALVSSVPVSQSSNSTNAKEGSVTSSTSTANPAGSTTIRISPGSSGQPVTLLPRVTSRVTSSSGSSSSQLPDLPTSSSRPSEVPPLPQLPQPDLAKGIRVTGVVVLGGIPKAIIKAPDEIVSRTVGPGDRLSNGQVVVKRIDHSNPDEPLVIVEQYGTELAIGIGKAPVQLASVPTSLSPVPALWYNKHH